MYLPAFNYENHNVQVRKYRLTIRFAKKIILKLHLQVAILAIAAFAQVSAAPSGILAPAPLVAAPLAPAVVTAQSSQVIARNYNALAAPVLAPAPVVAAPWLAPAPVARVAAPLLRAPVVAPAPLVRAPIVSPYLASSYVASPYAAPWVL